MADTYSSSSVIDMIHELLRVLDFHLLPSSPYSLGVSLLEGNRMDSVIPRFYSIVTCICVTGSCGEGVRRRVSVHRDSSFKSLSYLCIASEVFFVP